MVYTSTSLCCCVVFECYGAHLYLHVLTHSFPTRRSSDLHVAEGGQHHLDLGRLEHAAIFVVVAILHLDIRLREEAENLRQQIALVIGQLLRPVTTILPQRHLFRHPVELLLTLPEIEGPGIFDGLVLIGSLKNRLDGYYRQNR